MSKYWRHVKTGGVYLEIGRAVIEAGCVQAVIYRGMCGTFWVRPESEFMDGRFQLLDETHRFGAYKQSLRERIRAALDLIGRICTGEQKWDMHVPAEPERDPDLILSGLLRDLERACADHEGPVMHIMSTGDTDVGIMPQSATILIGELAPEYRKGFRERARQLFAELFDDGATKAFYADEMPEVDHGRS